MREFMTLARGVILTAWSEAPQGFAGCVLFARDGESVSAVRAKTDAFRRSYPDDAPLIAIDQEGGRVARLRAGAEVLPPMMALGALRDESLAVRAGEAIAHDLRRAGVNVDFAPVLDLAVEPENAVIGTRAFGSDPQLVARLGAALARGLRNGGVMPTYKHFPGHGSTAIDSHLALPRITTELATLRARDLVPFAACAGDDAAMMSAHVIVDAFDPEHAASLSRPIMHGLLRGELGFQGVAFTDCLQMNAVRDIGPIEAVVAAIAAGADCALISHDVELALACAERVERAVTSGELALERLREAYHRVMRLRRSARSPVALDVPAPHPGIGREIARRAVTLVRGTAKADARASLAISFEGKTYDAVGGDQLQPSLDGFAPNVHVIRLPLEPDDAMVSQARSVLELTGHRAIVIARSAHLHPAQPSAIDAIVQHDPDALVVSAREPFDLPLFARARHLLAIYGDDAASLGGLADVLFDGASPLGILPVTLARAGHV